MRKKPGDEAFRVSFKFPRRGWDQRLVDFNRFPNIKARSCYSCLVLYSMIWPKHSNVLPCKHLFMVFSCCLYPNSAEEILHSGIALTIHINILDSVLSSLVTFNFNLAKSHSLSYSITIRTQVEHNPPFALERKPPLINKTNQPINLQHPFFILAKTLFRVYFQD